MTGSAATQGPVVLARRAIARFALLPVLLLLPITADAQDSNRPGAFDFYVLALSWSPAYCELNRRRADPQQCGDGKNYRFIVHGLWPQRERGWPDYCPLPRDLPPSAGDIRSMLDIMPSQGLIQHQWRKHGTCSGLPPSDYFSKTRQAFEKIRIPETFTRMTRRGRISPEGAEAAFAAVNPGLTREGMAVSCNRGILTELRICLTKDLEFRACPSVDRSGCRASSLDVPPP
ncbi:ribonuclease T2 family protein [Pannonibacter indicus]|uniref:Ribonuclease I n=1 Tax=Pannonibacter indicus TaxID=466044 RepID=A0A0K6HMM9_9HYPH|nr:ribonuclease T2 [Pannonibacter indicus]CUA92165.1 Ribonuclease I [Pannonibacter indicus]